MSTGSFFVKIRKKGGTFMDEMKSVVRHVTYEVDYGKIRLKLAEIIDSRGITRHHLSTLTGVKYAVIDRYYKNKVERVDLDLLAKVCFVLNCQICDLLEFVPPPEA